MVTTESAPFDRARKDQKRLGAWYTPDHLVERVVAGTITEAWTRARGARRPLRVVDPACGDGRFLVAAIERARTYGVEVHAIGVDVDPVAVRTARGALAAARPAGAIVVEGDGLGDALDVAVDTALAAGGTDGRRDHEPDGGPDAVIGNPPFLSQLAATTARGGSSRHGGGPYADAAVEFLARSVDTVTVGGRVGLVLPQSVLASRDAAEVRGRVDRTCRHRWSWWSPDRHFDADVLVCAIGLERTSDRRDATDPAGPVDDGPPTTWAHVVAHAVGVPELPDLHADGTIGDRTHRNANFRDEYYGLVPGVVERSGTDDARPRLVTTGLIDPGRCHWAHRPVRFAKRSFAAPVVDVDRLDDRMRAWVARKSVAKVLVANQTRVIEAVADVDGTWLPGVPVTTVVPDAPVTVHEVAAVLTSPVASAHAWWRAAGTGLSSTSVRVGPDLIGSVPWPAGSLDTAVRALVRGDVGACGVAAAAAYGVDESHPVVAWWLRLLPGDRGSDVSR